ncbi:MAG: PorT family protein [Bacteroidales bacterium]|nr:PorT family protein [Bacteroidales bacterium]
MNRFIISLLLLSTTFAMYGQENLKIDDFSSLKQVAALKDSDLDSIDVKKNLVINDYSMIGVQYGAGVCRTYWNPRVEQDIVFMPMNVGVTYTRYGKMFGYMPYFGFQTGLFFSQDAYQFTYSEVYNYTYTIEGAEKAVIDVVELPVLCHVHYDMWNFKLLLNIGAYAGYRLGIQRFPGKTGNVNPEYEHAFTPTDRRFDYGIKGGVGFGIVFDPMEIHITATYKHSLSSLYDPDHYSQYYYRFAYPASLVVSAGVHFQLTKRSGKTKASLKKEAKDMVYKIEEIYDNFEGQSR